MGLVELEGHFPQTVAGPRDRSYAWLLHKSVSSSWRMCVVRLPLS